MRPARFERAAYGLEVRCSIQLSYGRSLLGKNYFNRMGVKSNRIFSLPSVFTLNVDADLDLFDQIQQIVSAHFSADIGSLK